MEEVNRRYHHGAMNTGIRVQWHDVYANPARMYQLCSIALTFGAASGFLKCCTECMHGQLVFRIERHTKVLHHHHPATSRVTRNQLRRNHKQHGACNRAQQDAVEERYIRWCFEFDGCRHDD